MSRRAACGRRSRGGGTVVREFGRLDGMVNNAGVAHDILEISEEEFDEIIGIQSEGRVLLCPGAAKQMIAQRGGGVIINMSSVNALLAIPTLATYADLQGRHCKQRTPFGAFAVRSAQHPRRGGRVGERCGLTWWRRPSTPRRMPAHIMTSRTPAGAAAVSRARGRPSKRTGE